MKTYTDVKRRAKTTELKAEDQVLVKHTGTKNKLANYWASDLFTTAKVNGLQLLLRAKEMEKYLPKTFQLWIVIALH